MVNNFDIYTRTAISNAVESAKKTGGEVRPEHFLRGIVEFGNNIQILLAQYGLTVYKIDKYLTYSPKVERVRTSSLAQNVLDVAEDLSKKYSSGQVSLLFLFLGLLDVYSTATTIFADCGIEPKTMFENLIAKFGVGQPQNKIEIPKSKPTVNPEQKLAGLGNAIQIQEKKISEKKYYSDDSVLSKLTTDLTAKAESGKLDPVIGRDKEIERMVQILSRRTKNNPVLVGEPGVGKTAVVEGLATEIVSGKIPSLADKRILSLDVASLVSGTKYRGEFEERLSNLITEVKKSQNIILFIDEIHNLVSAGSTESGSLDASNILKPMLARGELQTIGATTLDEYRKYFEKDQALERRFQPITVDPPTVEQTIEILNRLKERYEKFHGVTITDSAIRSACVLSDKYITDRFLPDKAIDLIDEASSKCRINSSSVVDENVIQEIVSDWTDIPVTKLTAEETEKLNNLDAILSKRVIGQDKAIKVVSQAIKRSRVGLKDRNKPIGSFMFLGQSGVGKTELAKAIAEALFGDENKLIRFDMTEYQDKASFSRLTGSAPGYVGFEEGGQLTEKVRKKPYCVLLFDEIEKADPEVFNIFLQIMDDGRLTDGHGRTVSFKNCIIIMTSNLGQESGNRSSLGFGAQSDETLEQRHLDALRKAMKPEFINRLDEIVVFKPLSHRDLSVIFDLLLIQLAKKLSEKNIGIRLSIQAKEYIVTKGTNREYGARPLKRTLRTLVEDKLSELILSGELSKGKTVWIDYIDNQLVFSIEKSA